MRGEFRLSLDEHLLEQGDSVMLLWKMHNRVNKRLESELRPGSPPKTQFPSEQLCPKCRAPRAQNDLVSTPTWHEKQLLNFLVHHYRSQSLFNNNSSASASDSSSSAQPSSTQLGSPLEGLLISCAAQLSLATLSVAPKIVNFLAEIRKK